VEASTVDENGGQEFVVEKQIPPLRCGMTTKEHATATANAE
jgi:hypothetical protein